MKAEVIKIDVPAGKGIEIPAYRVDIEEYQVIGYHESTTRKECKGACSWVVDYLNLKKLKTQKGE
jgi:hypothetical protein